MAVNKSAKLWVGPSNSDQYMGSRSTTPQVSALMSKSVSEVRRQAISSEVDQGLFRDGSGHIVRGGMSTAFDRFISSVRMQNIAQTASNGGNLRGRNGGTVKQTLAF